MLLQNLFTDFNINDASRAARVSTRCHWNGSPLVTEWEVDLFRDDYTDGRKPTAISAALDHQFLDVFYHTSFVKG